MDPGPAYRSGTQPAAAPSSATARPGRLGQVRAGRQPRRVTEIGQTGDAALTAAVYLCETGGDLSVPANFTAALTAYNDSQPYDNRVAQAAQQYAAVA
jgi:hypothetical protein